MSLKNIRPVLWSLLALALLSVLLIGPHSIAQDPPAGRSGAATDDDLESFDPSEEVPAETAVAFPVDI